VSIESLPELLIHQSTVFDFFCVFEDSGVSMKTSGITRVSDLEWCASVNKHKQRELRATPYSAENILMEEEIRSKENNKSLKIDHFGERRSGH